MKVGETDSKSIRKSFPEPVNCQLAQGFYQSSVSYPDRPALSIGGNEVSYRRLAQLAQSLSMQLQAVLADAARRHEIKNVSTTAPLTAVFGQRSVMSYAGILGALFAGHAYVPLNSEFPVSRLQNMLQRANCSSMIVDEDAVGLLPELLAGVTSPLLIVLPAAHNTAALRNAYPQHYYCNSSEPSDSAVTAPRHLNKLAYLLFTSGSTGVPKGVMVSHANVCHFLQSAQQRYRLGPSDRVSQTFALTFDLSVFDLFLAWGAGACVCVPGANELIKPGKYINRERLTLRFSVPSTALFMKKFRELKADKYPTLKWSLFCGEALSNEVARHWSAAAPNSIVENLYGPTELTIACTVHRWEPSEQDVDSGLVPIGEPLPGMRAMVVGEDLQEVTVGEQGELMLTGQQLTLGYLNDAEKSSKAFVKPPGQQETYYRTGDLVIRRAQRQPLEYIGRLDNQVQVNGHRVELGEVESVLRSHESVDEAVVIGWPLTPSGVGGVVAFVLGLDIDRKDLLIEIKSRLPAYMTPSRIEVVDRYPLNSNGKIDRKALIRTLKDNS